ncbi:hypothetical protein Val02_07630 [Virgisporangium aliadipatigenens]|uniref:YNCE-like beta-propeller domain-containing protein n=1 Tax=Virgisporangium aliadipatigenens TaxID=741659 RepID=A0A8J3YGA9_9ACTN|nr:YncE family protein [Virgisporangium aliadipatigenens]GIJ43877.1 hypothetical protein Val02_07630 [Virgisporangium aliadipatigenens]
MRSLTALALAGLLALAGCSGGDDRAEHAAHPAPTSVPPAPSSAPPPYDGLPGMPAPLDTADVYAAGRPGMLSDTVKAHLARVYVPNFDSGTVSVVDPATFKVIRTEKVGRGPQHVVPSWDLRTLWVNDNNGNDLVPIDPATGAFGKPVPVDDPYNLYFTPDGRYAVVMAEARRQIVFRDPHTMEVRKTLTVNCAGVNHVDFSPDGRWFIATCEFSGELLKVDVARQEVVAQLKLPGHHPMPQDIKISPDGRTWYVADMQTGGVWLLDGVAFTQPTFMATGDGAHGLYPSRDSKVLYVANRGEGSVSVVDFATRTVVNKWKIPGGGSPDMGGVSADGKVLWLSGRYHREVYALDTGDGHLLAKIPVGGQPHGLCVWPQPGRYSLGHTGILR